jgi:hypothetical protein
VYLDGATGQREAGIDAGGLTKEFFTSVITDLISSSSSSSSDTTTTAVSTTATSLSLSSSSTSSSSSLPQAQTRLLSRPPKLLRSKTVRGRGQPLLKSLPDNSLMITGSDR